MRANIAPVLTIDSSRGNPKRAPVRVLRSCSKSRTYRCSPASSSTQQAQVKVSPCGRSIDVLLLVLVCTSRHSVSCAVPLRAIQYSCWSHSSQQLLIPQLEQG